jgi:organic hydroperoxide reductase OsmC/OhrA
MATVTTGTVNGIDTEALGRLVGEIKSDFRKGIAGFRVATHWKGGMRSDTEVDSWSLGGQRVPHRFTVKIDEPRELCGSDAFANPQEYLLASANACMLNTFVAVCALQGVELESLVFESEGELDLRGFLGIDPNVKPGYEELRYTIRVKGNGMPEQYEKAHQAMQALSPNYYNIANGIRLRSTVIAE